MFGRFFGRNRPGKTSETEANAAQKGLELSREFQSDLSIFLSSAVDPAKERLWRAFQDRIGEIDPASSSNAKRQQIEEIYKDFVSVLPDFASTMGSAALTVLSGWLDLAKSLECEDPFVELIEKKIFERRNELFLKSTSYIANIL